jgi:hypothetical protein
MIDKLFALPITQTPRIMESKAPTSTQDGQIAAFINRAPYRLFRLAGPRACPPLEGPITGFMWTPYLPVRDRTQTGTRRTSCHEPSNRNRDAAWKVIFVLFHAKSHLTPNLTPRFPSGSRWTIPGRNTPVHRNPPALNMLCQVCP